MKTVFLIISNSRLFQRNKKGIRANANLTSLNPKNVGSKKKIDRIKSIAKKEKKMSRNLSFSSAGILESPVRRRTFINIRTKNPAVKRRGIGRGIAKANRYIPTYRHLKKAEKFTLIYRKGLVRILKFLFDSKHLPDQ